MSIGVYLEHLSLTERGNVIVEDHATAVVDGGEDEVSEGRAVELAAWAETVVEEEGEAEDTSMSRRPETDSSEKRSFITDGICSYHRPALPLEQRNVPVIGLFLVLVIFSFRKYILWIFLPVVL
jgi:hypothetical protein